jgi:hypothetical protein
MARRIQSPGVQITEFDYSERPPLAAGTSVFITGFADQGPTDEINFVQSISDFQLIYGNPTNAAERYFYHSVKSALNSNATILTNRMPYGMSAGDGFGSYYTALVYPVQFYNVGEAGGTAQTTALTISDATSAAFAIQGSNGVLYAITYRGEASTAVNTLTAAVNSLGGTIANVTGTAGSTTSFAAAIANYFETLNPSIFDINISGSTITFTNSAVGTITNAPSGIATKTTPTITIPGTTTSSGNLTTNLNGVSGVYFLGAPKSFPLTKSEYESIIDGSAFTWSATANATSGLSALSTFGGAGVIVLNERQTSIDQSFQGYYIGLADNFDADNQGSNFNKIRSIKTVTNVVTSGITNFINIPTTTLAFQITSTADANIDSLARSIETGSNGYVIGNKRDFDDVLNVGVYKLTNSVFQDDPNRLIYSLQELYTGSVTNNFRQFASPTGGEPLTYSLQTIVGTRSPNATMFINPYINNVAADSIGKGSSYDTASPYLTLKKVRLLTQTLVDGATDNTLSASIGFAGDGGVVTNWSPIINTLSGAIGLADAIYPLGTYNPVGNSNQKIIGNIPTKVEKSLGRIKDPELFDVDILIEGGLGTIYAFTQIAGTSAYDDTAYNSNYNIALSGIQKELVTTSNDIVTYYQAVANKFLDVAQSEKDGGRGDSFFVADPIRQFFVAGANSKVIDKTTTTSNYQKIYYALRNLYNNYDTSYMAAYSNWVAVIDDITGLVTWVPASGFIAAIMANTDAGTGPWEAPAGFNRGIIRGAVDVGWSPNQRQRDDLYKLGINPIASFPGQGIVVYGQKTAQNKPSAFDRINVRRNFLFMEKTVKDIMKFFVFEPNTKFTRDRVLATLNPFFINIQANGGLYDFLVVCDERNNSDTTIEDNTLVVDIYLKPTRTAEFILVNFYATRQSASFEELVARG